MTMTAVLVDDDEFDRRALRRVLSKDSRFAELIDVPDASALCDLLHKLDGMRVVITDLRMPGLDGFGVIKQVRSHPDLRDTPIVAMSSSNAAQDRINARDAGADEFFPKPTGREELRALPERIFAVVAAQARRVAANVGKP